MAQKMAAARRKEVAIPQKLSIFVLQDILNAMRNRRDLFSRVKSGKFSSDENKLTSPTIISIMAWAVAYFSPQVYQSLHDKISLRLTFLFCVPARIRIPGL